MRALRAWAIRLAGLLNPRRRSEQFDAELESHLEMHIEDNIRRGLSPEEARRHALIALGGAQVLRDSYRDRGTVPFVESLGQDVRFAFRMLRKAPGFTVTAIIVLALGIGANAAVFSLINAVLLKPLNGGRHEPLVGLYSGERTRPDAFRTFSYPELVDLRARTDVFADLFAEGFARAGVTEDGLTRRAPATYVSSNYFQALGAVPAAGRFFTLDEERPGAGVAVAVVSYDYWRRRGRPADIAGRTIVVNARPLTIVGVAPEGLRGTMPVMSTEIWLPLGAASLTEVDGGLAQDRAIANDRSAFSLMLTGTLAPGVSEDEARARLVPIAAALEAAHPQTNRDQRLVIVRRSRVNFGLPPGTDAEPMIGAAVLMIIAGMVLIVACLNLANLQLARGSVRRSEIAVRLALGGSRRRIVRQLFVEGLLLAVVAGAIGLMVAWGAADRIVAWIASLLQGQLFIDVAPDGRILTLVAIGCVVSALGFSLGPAMKLSRLDLVTAMKSAGAQPAVRRRRMSLPGLMVGTQVALSLALLAAAGVFARASLNAAVSNPGFVLDGGVIAEVDAAIARLDEATTRTAYARILERLRSRPDVRAASAASIVPLGNIRDGGPVRWNGRSASATYTVVGSDYFAALGVPIIEGREFTRLEEARPTEPVAVVDETLVARLFSGRSPIGEFVQLALDDVLEPEPLRIVGVVRSVRDDILGEDDAHVYVPYGRQFRSGMTFHVRTTSGGEAAMMPRLREVIEGVDARLPVLSVRALATLRDGSPDLFAVTLGATLFTAFGLIGLVLSAAGLYGLRAYLVSQRTRELGIRFALGATRSGVVGQLLKEGAITAAFGVGAGLALAIALLRVLSMSGMLYQVSAWDPIVLTTAPVVLVAATLAASYIPARRALRIDPAVALRPE